MMGSYYPISGFGVVSPGQAAWAAQAAAAGQAAARAAAAAQGIRASQAVQAAQAALRAALLRPSAASYAAAMGRGVAAQQAQLAARMGRPASAVRILQAAAPQLLTPVAQRMSIPTPPAMPPQMLTPSAVPSYMVPTPASGYKPTMAMYGFGATPAFTIDPVEVWKDWSEQTPASTTRAAKWIQAALNQLGYGVPKPLVVDGVWGEKSKTAYNAFSAAQGTTSNAGYMTQDGVQKIADLLNASQKPGPAEPVAYEEKNGVLIPVTLALKKAGIGTGLLVAGGALAAVVIGGLVLGAKKKPHHVAAPMHANRRRRHRR